MGLFDKLFGGKEEDKNSFLDALKDAAEKLKNEAEKAGIPMAEREFHCRGEFKGIHKGRPNEADLAAAAAFAKSLAGME